MAEQAKYYFGIKDNKIIAINHITPAENGEQCNCVCPGCGGVFVANTLGKKQQAGERIKYFSHKAEGVLCNINKYQETVLHHLAKECFQEIDFINLPNAFIGWEDTKKYYTDNDLACLKEPKLSELINLQETVCASDSLYIDKNSVTLEKQVSGLNTHFRPDVVLKDIDGNDFYIEICVAHPSSENKISFYERYNLNAIEITLGICDFDFEDEHIKEKIKSILTYETENKKWLFKSNRDVFVKNLLIKQHSFFQKCFDSFYYVIGVEEVNTRSSHGFRIYYSYKSQKCISGRMTDTAWINDTCLEHSGGVLPKEGDLISFYYPNYYRNPNSNIPSKFIIK